MKQHRLKNIERGKRVFVLANGPSINQFDLSILRNEVVIGMNASTMLEKKFGFVSKYYVVSDLRFINHPEKRRWATSELNPKTRRLVRRDLVAHDEQVMAPRTTYVPVLGRDGFSKHLDRGYYFGCTTTMLALQAAYHLGCREVYLLGCDLKYSQDLPRFYRESRPQIEDSFTSIQIMNITNAATVFEQAGGRLHNCSSASFLRPYLGYTALPEAFKPKREAKWEP